MKVINKLPTRYPIWKWARKADESMLASCYIIWFQNIRCEKHLCNWQGICTRKMWQTRKSVHFHIQYTFGERKKAWCSPCNVCSPFSSSSSGPCFHSSSCSSCSPYKRACHLAHLVILHKCLRSLCGLQMAASSALNWWKVCGCKSAHTRFLSAQVLFFRKIDHFKELLHAIPETPSTFFTMWAGLYPMGLAREKTHV